MANIPVDLPVGTGQRVKTTQYQNTDGLRGLLATPSKNDSGYIGLQAHPGGRVAFRHIQIV